MSNPAEEVVAWLEVTITGRYPVTRGNVANYDGTTAAEFAATDQSMVDREVVGPEDVLGWMDDLTVTITPAKEQP